MPSGRFRRAGMRPCSSRCRQCVASDSLLNETKTWEASR
jgi:hypothetical protein